MKIYSKKIKFILYLSMVLSSSAFAESGWRGYDKVSEVLVNYHNQGFAIRFEGSVPLNGCLSADEIVINRTTAGYNEMYSASLAALLAGKTVNVYVNGTCENNRNVVIAFSVK